MHENNLKTVKRYYYYTSALGYILAIHLFSNARYPPAEPAMATQSLMRETTKLAHNDDDDDGGNGASDSDLVLNLPQ